MGELFTALGNLAKELGLTKLALLCLIATLGYGAFEHREEIIKAVLASNLAMYALGVGVLLTLIGMVVSGLLKKIERSTEVRIEDLTTQIKELKEELKECERECRTETREAHEAMREQLDRLERALDIK